MDNPNLEDMKKEAAIDNSRLEELMKEEITPQMQMEFFEILKQSQLYMPVAFSQNMFEGIENAKPGDIFEPEGQTGFSIQYLSDENGNKAVPLFTSDEMMQSAGVRSSVIAFYMSDLAVLLKQSDEYSVIAINPFTEHDVNMPIEAFLGLFEEPSEEEKEFIKALDEILTVMKEHSVVIKDDMAFMIRSDENFMKENAVDGVFIPPVPFNVSSSPKYGEGLKYTNILLFNRGKRALPVASPGENELDTLIAPGTEFILEKEVDEFTTVWKCGAQPFYDE